MAGKCVRDGASDCQSFNNCGGRLSLAWCARMEGASWKDLGESSRWARAKGAWQFAFAVERGRLGWCWWEVRVGKCDVGIDLLCLAPTGGRISRREKKSSRRKNNRHALTPYSGQQWAVGGGRWARSSGYPNLRIGIDFREEEIWQMKATKEKKESRNGLSVLSRRVTKRCDFGRALER